MVAADLGQRGFGGVAGIRMQGAHGAAQLHGFRDDVGRGAAMEHADGDDGGMQRVDLPAHHGLGAGDEGGGGDDRVDRVIRMRGMAGAAAHLQREPIRRRQGAAAAIAEAADRHVRVVMEAERHVHTLQRPVGDHGGGAAQRLFGRLEDQHHPSGEVRRHVEQHRGDTQQGGGVNIVPAGVHLAVDGAGEGQAGRFMDR